ncbi:MAG TPA: HPF/RaiA family ribosome-associated protein [bacterium]
MKNSITFKHVQPKPYLRNLVEELLGHFEDHAQRLAEDSAFLHVVIEQNAARTLFRVSIHCTVPKREFAVRDEGHEPVAVLREAFSELERQLDKFKAKLRREHLRKRATARKRRMLPAVEAEG